MSKTKTVEITIKAEYTFQVEERPLGQVALVFRNDCYCGMVGNGDTSGGMPEEVVQAARAFLFEVNPSVDPEVIRRRIHQRPLCPEVVLAPRVHQSRERTRD